MNERAALGVGRALAEAREAQGLEIADIAQQIKFMPRQIQALEAERFDALPGPTIARGMVRTYARFLKIDPDPLLQRMGGHVEPRDATPQLAERYNQPVPFSDSGRRTTVAYLALSAVVLAIAGGVLYEWRYARQAPAPVSTESPEAQAPAKVPEVVAKAEPPRPAAPRIEAPKAETPKAEAPKPEAPKPQLVKPQPRETTPAAKVEAPKAEAPKVEAPKAEAPAQPVVAAKDIGARAAGNRLVLQFDEDAWAEVVDANGRQLISSLNRAGTQRMVRVSPPFNVVLGNAQHVRMIYNDRPFDLAPHIKVEVARFTVK